MKPLEGKNVYSGIAILAAVLAMQPVSAQNRTPPPLPPPSPPRVVPLLPNFAILPLVNTQAVANPAPRAVLAPTVAPAPVASSPVVVTPVAPAPTTDPSALRWDAEVKEYAAKTGEREAKF